MFVKIREGLFCQGASMEVRKECLCGSKELVYISL